MVLPWRFFKYVITTAHSAKWTVIIIASMTFVIGLIGHGVIGFISHSVFDLDGRPQYPDSDNYYKFYLAGFISPQPGGAESMTLPSLGLLPVPPAPVPAILDVRPVGPTSTISGEPPRRINITKENNNKTTPPSLPGSLRQDTPRTTTSSTTGGYRRRRIYNILGPRTATPTSDDEGAPETPRPPGRGGRAIGELRTNEVSLPDSNPTRLGTESTTAGPLTATTATDPSPLNGQDLQWAPSSSPRPVLGLSGLGSILSPPHPFSAFDGTPLLDMESGSQSHSFFLRKDRRYLGHRPVWPYIRTPYQTAHIVRTYVDETIKTVLFYKHKTLANFQKWVYGSIRPIVREYVDETINFVGIYKHKTLAIFQKMGF